MLVVNLFGAPGAGKSTLALLVAGILKTKYPEFSTECPDEIAKLAVYDEAHKALRCQIYIAGRQHWQIARCEGHADIVVCDSPILLSPVYGEDLPAAFFDVCVHYHNMYPSLNYFVTRRHAFESKARVHGEIDEAPISAKIEDTLKRGGVVYRETVSMIAEAYTIADEAAKSLKVKLRNE
jgi:energy-coupling factor transporter ATP-binding protein EcfA2